MASSSTPSSKSDSYILNRDVYAATHVNSEHWVWHQELGYKLHPTITVPMRGRIADVATETAAWLLEVAPARMLASLQCFLARIGHVRAISGRAHRYIRYGAYSAPDGCQKEQHRTSCGKSGHSVQTARMTTVGWDGHKGQSYRSYSWRRR